MEIFCVSCPRCDAVKVKAELEEVTMELDQDINGLKDLFESRTLVELSKQAIDQVTLTVLTSE